MKPPGDFRWKRLYEMLLALAAQRTVEGSIDSVMEAVEDLVPADRGVAVMKMEDRLPLCIRWPGYAEPFIPRFNSELNRRSPMYYEPPYTVLPPVDWFRFRETEYHNEFNVPLDIRHSIGVGFTDSSSATAYTLWVHRSPREKAFESEDLAALECVRSPVSSIISLIGSGTESPASRIRSREAAPGCGLLSRRELEVAQLICRRESMREIAKQLGISPRTVERHALHIYEKLDLSGRRELITLCAPSPPPAARSGDASQP